MSNGGGSPVWSADGKELYFLNGSNRLIAAEIGPGPAFSVTKLERLFDATALDTWATTGRSMRRAMGSSCISVPRAPRSRPPRS